MTQIAQIRHILLQLKLSPKEVAIFLSLVKLGRAVASAIARDANITRTHIYDIVQTLMDKGLVSEVEVAGVKNYEAVDHAGLLAFVSREQKELVGLEKKLQQVASDFQALQLGQQQKTKVRFFDGVEGVKNIYGEIRHDLAQQVEPFELLTIFSPEKLEHAVPGSTYLDYPNMILRDIVAEDGMLDAYKAQMSATKNTATYKVWPKERGIFPTDTIAWKNKIAYIDLVGNPSGIIVENEATYRSFAMWFEVVWESLG